MTNPAEMMDPPQKWLPDFWRETCHGATAVEVTVSPLTIRLDGAAVAAATRAKRQKYNILG